MKAILDVGVVCVIVLMMGAVGMELEGRHFRAVLQRKGTLVLILVAQAAVPPALGFLLLVYVLMTQRAQLAAEWQQTAVVAAVFMGLALLAGLAFGRLLRLPKEDSVTVGIGLAVRNVGLASAIAITLLNRIEYVGFAVVYFLTEVPLLLGVVAVYRCYRIPPAPQVDLSRNPR